MRYKPLFFLLVAVIFLPATVLTQIITPQQISGIWHDATNDRMFALYPSGRLEIIWNSGFFGEGTFTLRQNVELSFFYRINSDMTQRTEHFRIQSVTKNKMRLTLRNLASNQIFDVVRSSDPPPPPDVCNQCYGNGRQQCTVCHSPEGKIQKVKYEATGRPVIYYDPCWKCNGAGMLAKCSRCNGTGRFGK